MAQKFANATRALQRALPGCIYRDRETRYRYSFDSLKISFLPEAVAMPGKERDVGEVLRVANRYGVPVTPRGAGSNRTAGATPIEGGWVLDLSRLKNVRIDASQGLARVQAGVITARLQEMAESRGWYYPPDPSSKRFSTIGGNIACNAGGLRGGKYGVTRDYVMALSGFLPTGEWVRWGRDVRKFASGFNMRDLWIGSEGLLGVVTSATLKLVPRPEAKWTALVAFSEDKSVFDAIEKLLEEGIVPSICEFMDQNAVKGAEIFQNRPVFPGMKDVSVLLLELDGDSRAVHKDSRKVAVWAKQYGQGFRQAKTSREAEAIWQVRRACSPAMYRLADGKINEDVVVPLNKQADLMRFVRYLEKRVRLPIATFGHAADGNLHVNVLYRKENKAECERAEDAVTRLMKKVVHLGGGISGEHGIGLAKSPYLGLQYSRDEIDAMMRIKKALDPNGILNSSKIFKETRIWGYDRVRHTFPWDRKKS